MIIQFFCWIFNLYTDYKERFTIMMNNPLPIQTYIHPGNRVHLVGIGGVSMCPLAEILQGMGLTVQGSDISNSGHNVYQSLLAVASGGAVG